MSELLGSATGSYPKRRVFDGRVNLSSNELSHPALDMADLDAIAHAARGNFITVRIGDPGQAETLAASLGETGYRVRNLAAVPGLEGSVRFTVCDAGLTRAFLAAWEAAAQLSGARPGASERALW